MQGNSDREERAQGREQGTAVVSTHRWQKREGSYCSKIAGTHSDQSEQAGERACALRSERAKTGEAFPGTFCRKLRLRPATRTTTPTVIKYRKNRCRLLK